MHKRLICGSLKQGRWGQSAFGHQDCHQDIPRKRRTYRLKQEAPLVSPLVKFQERGTARDCAQNRCEWECHLVSDFVFNCQLLHCMFWHSFQRCKGCTWKLWHLDFSHGESLSADHIYKETGDCLHSFSQSHRFNQLELFF